MSALDTYDAERQFALYAQACGYPISEPLDTTGRVVRFSLADEHGGQKSGAYAFWMNGKSGDTGRTYHNTLFIPCQDLTTREFVSLHTVSGRPDAGGKFSKRWAKGTYGGVFVITNGIDCRQGHGRVIVCEGIATALSIFEFFTRDLNEPDVVVCACMDSGNLTKQFAPIASAFKGRSLCIVPDDDDAGAKAAEAGAGFGFTALPIPKMGGVRDGARI